MLRRRLVIMLGILLIACSLTLVNSRGPEGFFNTDQKPTLEQEFPMKISSSATGASEVKVPACISKNRVEWTPYAGNFSNKEVQSNPFAKSSNAHCRTDSQCKSGSCKKLHCV